MIIKLYSKETHQLESIETVERILSDPGWCSLAEFLEFQDKWMNREYKYEIE
jgi:hypothetical protein